METEEGANQTKRKRKEMTEIYRIHEPHSNIYLLVNYTCLSDFLLISSLKKKNKRFIH